MTSSPTRAPESPASPSYGAVSSSPRPGKKRETKGSPWLRKPVRIASAGTSPAPGGGGGGAEPSGLRRHLTLFDLICVGVGATVGSGIFVLCGLIARNYAGPATFLSWAIAGLAACLSGLCYAELAGKFPTAGSSYAYAYVSMGELPAVVAGACLTLEYVFSASAVARSWGDKIVEYVRSTGGGAGEDGLILRVLEPGLGLNPMAFVVAAASMFLLLEGVRESKAVTNVFTVAKIGLVIFMCVGGFSLVDTSNLVPMVPPEFGLPGIFRGATSSFFGYIGYDEICCISGEAKNPSTNLPRAVLATLVVVTTLYMLAAIALAGMVPYPEISATSGFPAAFRYRHWEGAAQITALGELITLPLVVLVTIMAQPRLQYAMAVDGLLPPIFARLDSSGNLWHGTLISGTLMIIIATCIPFTYLDDLISAGILIAFSITDSSVILLRHESPGDRPYLLQKYLGLFHGLSFIACLLLDYSLQSAFGVIGAVGTCVSLISISHAIATTCPASLSSDGNRDLVEEGEAQFETPFVPHLPLLGTFVNWYLIAQLEFLGLVMLVTYLLFAVAFYFAYGAEHSVGNNVGWEHIKAYELEVTKGHERGVGYDQEHTPLIKILSIPRSQRGDEYRIVDGDADETQSL